jgi:DNA-binding SARP family transcriptional activator
LAYIAYELGELDGARAALDAAKRIEDAQRNPVIAHWRLLIEAERALLDGDQHQLSELLRDGFAIGRERQIFSRHGPGPTRLAELCRVALLEGIEPEYVRTLIRRRMLAANPPPYEVEAWPWMVRVRVCGAFAVTTEGEPTSVFGKSKMPPLLLKAIVAWARGGNSVSIEKLVSTLWPEADGDSGVRSFEVTLGRLRKALGSHGRSAIRVEGKRLSLDSTACWTDVDAIHALTEAIASSLGSGRPPTISDPKLLRLWADRLCTLYRGPFGHDDELPPALLGFQEQLRQKVARAIEALGSAMRLRGESRAEEALYARALDADEGLQSLLPRTARPAAGGRR